MTHSHHDFDATPAFWYRMRGAGKPYAPACEKNKGPILVVLRRVFADAGDVIEIGSGTGQHAVWFAAGLTPDGAGGGAVPGSGARATFRASRTKG